MTLNLKWEILLINVLIFNAHAGKLYVYRGTLHFMCKEYSIWHNILEYIVVKGKLKQVKQI